MSDATAVIDALECEECGATETASGQPFDAGRLNRHIAAAHPDLWEKVRDDKAIADQTKAKTGGKTAQPAAKAPKTAAPAKGRHDLSGGLQANLAVVALIIGQRNNWKGQVLTSFAPRLAADLNTSAQEGPQWWYDALAMASVGGAHMAVVFDALALVVAFQAEKSDRARGLVPSMRAMGMPIPTGAWETGQSSPVPPARPMPGPAVVDIQPDIAKTEVIPAGEGRVSPSSNGEAGALREGVPASPFGDLDLGALQSVVDQMAPGLGVVVDEASLAAAAEFAQQMIAGNDGPRT